MNNTSGVDTSRTELQAERPLRRTWVGMNGGGRTMRNLPECLVVEQLGAVTVVRLSRPAKRNALDLAMIAGIEAIFSSPPEGARAIVLHGEGEHFCAGADLARVVETDGTAALRLSRMAHQAFDRIEHGAVPVVAVLHGAVIGGGLEIAAAAHIRVAEQSAFYALPEGVRGIFVGGGGAVRLPRLIGAARMADMMLTGRVYGAEEGQALGISHYLVDNGQGLAKGLELAGKIARNAPITNFAVIHALPRIAEANPREGFMMEALMAAVAQGSEEAKDRLRAFLEKRAKKVTEF